jgi:hypothetical protein
VLRETASVLSKWTYADILLLNNPGIDLKKYIEERCLRLKLLPKRQRKCSRDWKRNISKMHRRQ